MRLSSSLLGLAAAVSVLADDSQKPIKSPKSSLGIPLLGFGTWNLSPDDHNASKAVTHAIRTGFRHIDCAKAYNNEEDVGRGIAEGLKVAGIRREDIWVTSKLWNSAHKPIDVPIAFEKTLKDLGVGYLDLYLMHWPVAQYGGQNYENFLEVCMYTSLRMISPDNLLKTWVAIETLKATGKVREIGISNFSPDQLSFLLAHTSTKPFAHQMELHPYLPQTSWLQYHHAHGIHVTAYSPFGNANPTYHEKDAMRLPKDGEVKSNVKVPGGYASEAEAEAFNGTPAQQVPIEVIKSRVMSDIALRRGCTPAQIALIWGITRGTSVIPKSQHPDRIEENFDVYKCKLEYEDLSWIEQMGEVNLTRFNNPSKAWGVKLYEHLQDAEGQYWFNRPAQKV